MPVHLCNLPLKVLIASNNKLVSIPEEIGQLRQLTELVSMHLISDCYFSALGPRMICVCHSVSKCVWFCIEVLEEVFKYSEILKEFYVRERCPGEQMIHVNLNVFSILERKPSEISILAIFVSGRKLLYSKLCCLKSYRVT